MRLQFPLGLDQCLDPQRKDFAAEWHTAPSGVSARSAWWLGLAASGSRLLYLWHYLERGWIRLTTEPLHSAERVLNGELPHRDSSSCTPAG